MNYPFSTGDTLPAATLTEIARGSSLYAADAGGDDTYAITVEPAPSALTTGMMFSFKPTTANTGACTLDVNGLGAIAIKKWKDQDLVTGDILGGQMVVVQYDGTYFQLISNSAIKALYATASANLRLSADTERTSPVYFTGGVWVIYKQILIPVGGTVSIAFDLGSASGAARIYVDGVAAGTQRNATGSYVTYTESIKVHAGAITELRHLEGDGSATKTRNYRVYYDLTDAGFGIVVQD